MRIYSNNLPYKNSKGNPAHSVHMDQISFNNIVILFCFLAVETESLCITQAGLELEIHQSLSQVLDIE